MFQLPKGGDLDDVAIATSTVNIGTNPIGIVIDDTSIEKSEILQLIDAIRDRFIREDYPLT